MFTGALLLIQSSVRIHGLSLVLAPSVSLWVYLLFKFTIIRFLFPRLCPRSYIDFLKGTKPLGKEVTESFETIQGISKCLV